MNNWSLLRWVGLTFALMAIEAGQRAVPAATGFANLAFLLLAIGIAGPYLRRVVRSDRRIRERQREREEEAAEYRKLAAELEEGSD